MLNKQGWTSEYRRKKFEERYNKKRMTSAPLLMELPIKGQSLSCWMSKVH